MRDQADEMLATDEVATFLKAVRHAANRPVLSRKLQAFELDTWRFRRADLDQWIAGRIGKAALADQHRVQA